MTDPVRAVAPGRVNLIGDHTDHAGGLALPCAIDLGIIVAGERDERIELTSSIDGRTLSMALPATLDGEGRPGWGRHVAAVATLLPRPLGLRGRIESDLPVGAGLSSSAALAIASALALGHEGSAMDLAHLARRAEHLATDTPTGLLDQLAITHGVAGHALCIDFSTLAVEPVRVPDDTDIVVVHSGEERTVEHSAYGERVASCEQAAALVGPLPTAPIDAIDAIDDPRLRRRARHVRTECDRVREAAAALRIGDLSAFGALMVESQRSLREDFEVSTPRLDSVVDELLARPGVYGARLTGAGFGGCVVAVCDRGAVPEPEAITGRGWLVRPTAAAHLD